MRMDRAKFSSLERRRFPRLSKNIFIRCRSKSHSSNEFKAIAENISGGGLMFETDRYIPTQTELGLEIYQPMICSESVILSISVLAKVIWTREKGVKYFEEGENTHRVGVEFLEIREDDRRKIAKYVEEKTL